MLEPRYSSPAMPLAWSERRESGHRRTRDGAFQPPRNNLKRPTRLKDTSRMARKAAGKIVLFNRAPLSTESGTRVFFYSDPHFIRCGPGKSWRKTPDANRRSISAGRRQIPVRRRALVRPLRYRTALGEDTGRSGDFDVFQPISIFGVASGVFARLARSASV